MQPTLPALALGVVLGAFGCGASVAEPAASDAGETGSETGSVTSPLCCPISPAPGCCMAFGGSAASCRGKDVGAATVCDNLPAPGDSRWERRTDANGCPYWYAPPEVPIACKVGGSAGGDGGGSPRPDSVCKWTDDAGVHEELCPGSFGCCNASAEGTRCVPEFACVKPR